MSHTRERHQNDAEQKKFSADNPLQTFFSLTLRRCLLALVRAITTHAVKSAIISALRLDLSVRNQTHAGFLNASLFRDIKCAEWASQMSQGSWPAKDPHAESNSPTSSAIPVSSEQTLYTLPRSHSALAVNHAGSFKVTFTQVDTSPPTSATPCACHGSCKRFSWPRHAPRSRKVCTIPCVRCVRPGLHRVTAPPIQSGTPGRTRACKLL